ncbi:hypothetical protein [Adhaeretor mobilis]|nr:hypothetical protein [Adhaeretor mobilis]
MMQTSTTVQAGCGCSGGTVVPVEAAPVQESAPEAPEAPASDETT